MSRAGFAGELLLLALDDDTGRLRGLSEKALAAAVAGAWLLELAFRGRIDNDLSLVAVLDGSSTGDALLDATLDCLPAAGESLTLGQALAQVTLRSAELLDGTLDRMVSAGVLRRSGPGVHHPKAGRREVQELRDRVRRVVLGDETPEPRDAAFVGLLHACNLTPWLFSPAELEARAERIAALARIEILVQALASALGDFEKSSFASLAEDLAKSRFTAPASVAGGKAAVVSTLRHVFGQAGILRGSAVLARMNQVGGFDCPGCAWPDPEKGRSRFEFCENGARSLASEATLARADAAFFAAWSIAGLAAQSNLWLDAQGRLTQPMVRRRGASHYEPIGWDEAFALAAKELRALDSPDEAVFYTSGHAGNEAAFLVQLLARRLGTNNLPGSANLCHQPSGVGLEQTLGSSKGTVRLEDLEETDLLLVFGHNPGSNHPRMLKDLESLVRRGGRIVAVNPMREASLRGFSNPQELRAWLGLETPLASDLVQVKAGGDLPFLKGLVKAVLDEEERRPGEVLDQAFLDAFTTDLDAVRREAAATPGERLAEACGVPWERIEEIARLYCSARRVVACWGLGLVQHPTGTANVRELVNLMLLRGNVGRPGTGLFPIRGHSNVQGTATMGVRHRPQPAFLERLGEAFGFAPPREAGLDAAAAIRAMHEGKVKVLVSIGGNLAATAPDSSFTAEALSRARLTVMVSTKLCRSHLVTGEQALILPCLGRSEADGHDGVARFVTVEDATGRVQASRGAAAPASDQLRSEVEIVAGLARATFGADGGIPWARLGEEYDLVRDFVSRIVPGFTDFDRRVRAPGGFYVPNPARERRFCEPSGRARFTVNALPSSHLSPGELLLTTVRSHDQFNSTVFGLDDRYRGIRSERAVLLMSAEEMRERGLGAEQLVDVTSAAGTLRHLHAIPYDLPRGMAVAYFPEANAVVPAGHVEPETGTPGSKSVSVRVTASRA